MPRRPPARDCGRGGCRSDAGTRVPSSKTRTAAGAASGGRALRVGCELGGCCDRRGRRACRPRRQLGRHPCPRLDRAGGDHARARAGRRDEQVRAGRTVARERRRAHDLERCGRLHRSARVAQRARIERVQAMPDVDRIAMTHSVEPAAAAALWVPGRRGEEEPGADEGQHELGRPEHEGPQHDAPEARRTESGHVHRSEAEARLADRDALAAVQRELHRAEHREQALAHRHEHERKGERTRRDRGGIAARARDRAAEHRHPDRARNRQQDPDERIEGERGGASTTGRRHQAEPPGVLGVGPPVRAETGDRLVVDVHRDAHIAPGSEGSGFHPIRSGAHCRWGGVTIPETAA